MAETSRHDTWQAADRYEAYMGRWSRQIAPRFLDWLNVGSGLDWLDIGSGTGALSAAILAQCNPKSLISIDSSEGFVATARATIQDRRAEFHVGDAQAVSLETASRDAVVSALMLNFVPDKLKALREMKRVADNPLAASTTMPRVPPPIRWSWPPAIQNKRGGPSVNPLLGIIRKASRDAAYYATLVRTHAERAGSPGGQASTH
jgi:SAM-dependent methyltransferase